MHYRDSESGFTLIELMVAVAIVGILAAAVIPIFQDYVVKTQMERATSELAAYRSVFEGELSVGGALDNSRLGYVPSSLIASSSVVNVASLNPDNSGHLEVTMGGTAHPNLSGIVIRHVRSAEGRWSCVLDVSLAVGWKDAYLPKGCLIL